MPGTLVQHYHSGSQFLICKGVESHRDEKEMQIYNLELPAKYKIEKGFINLIFNKTLFGKQVCSLREKRLFKHCLH